MFVYVIVIKKNGLVLLITTGTRGATYAHVPHSHHRPQARTAHTPRQAKYAHTPDAISMACISRDISHKWHILLYDLAHSSIRLSTGLQYKHCNTNLAASTSGCARYRSYPTSGFRRANYDRRPPLQLKVPWHPRW